MAEGKRSRKHGNNKVYCQRYEKEMREERNRKRKIRRHQNAIAKKAIKIALRLEKGKPVHLRHIKAALKNGEHVHMRLLARLEVSDASA